MNKKSLCVRLSLILLLASTSLLAAEQNTWPVSFFKGWDRSVRGGGFGYHSPEPDVRTSMLLRSEDSLQFIEWETEKLPLELTSETVRLVWIFGMDANPDSHSYKLFLNGKYCLEFSNPVVSEKKTWTVNGSGGASLTFLTTMLDKYDDPMGYAFLTLPSAIIKKGEKQILKISGESAGSRSWYMTFECGVTEKISIEQQEAVIRGADKINYFPMNAGFVHLGDPVKTTIEQSGGITTSFTLQPGYNAIRLLFPATKGFIRKR